MGLYWIVCLNGFVPAARAVSSRTPNRLDLQEVNRNNQTVKDIE